MERGMPTKVAASCMGLSAFAIAIVAGLGAGNPAEEILTRAIVAMVLMYALGQALGAMGERAIDQRVAQHRVGNPVTGPGSPVRANTSGAIVVGADEDEPIAV